MEKALAKKSLRAEQTKETLLSPFQQSGASLWGSGYSKIPCQPGAERKIQFYGNLDFINHNYALNTCNAEIWSAQKVSLVLLRTVINIWALNLSLCLDHYKLLKSGLSQFLLNSTHCRQVFGHCLSAQAALSSPLVFSLFFSWIKFDIFHRISSTMKTYSSLN